MSRQLSSLSLSLQWYSVSGERSEVLRNTSLSLEDGERGERMERGKERREGTREREKDMREKRAYLVVRMRNFYVTGTAHTVVFNIILNTCEIFNVILNKR